MSSRHGSAVVSLTSPKEGAANDVSYGSISESEQVRIGE